MSPGRRPSSAGRRPIFRRTEPIFRRTTPSVRRTKAIIRRAKAHVHRTKAIVRRAKPIVRRTKAITRLKPPIMAKDSQFPRSYDRPEARLPSQPGRLLSAPSFRLPRFGSLVPKLRLGTPCWGETPFRSGWPASPDAPGNRVAGVSPFPNGVWERGAKGLGVSLVPKLRLGTPCWGETPFRSGRPPSPHAPGNRVAGVSPFPNGVWERGAKTTLRSRLGTASPDVHGR